VVVGGRKLVGSAQRSEGRTILQHGSILLGGDQGVVATCLGGAEGGAAFTTLSALLHPLPTREELAAALLAGFEDALGIRPLQSALTAAESARAAQLLPHFRSEAWTWHRGTVV
jgi:lipoate-protein ligase A